MSALGLTRRQRQLLQFIKGELKAGRLSPTFEEMMGATGLRSKSSIHRLITGLERRGHIARAPRLSRSISTDVSHRIICDVCRSEIARRA